MEFQPDISIPAVAEAEKNTLQELAAVDAELAAMPEALVIAFMVGERPSGGPYKLTIEDDSRWKTDKEYKLQMKLIESPSDDNEKTLFDGGVYPQDIQKWIYLNNKRWDLLGFNK